MHSAILGPKGYCTSLPLIIGVIRKVLAEKAEILLLAPHWPRRPWFANLINLSVARP